MPTPTFQGPSDNAGINELRDYLFRMIRDLNYLLQNLDDINVNRLDAKVIIANTITANKMNVTELSAISANLGTINAGSLTTNANINVGTDARIGNVLYLKETDSSGTKGIFFDTNTGTSARITALSGDLSINTDGFITLTIGSSAGLVVNNKVSAPTLAATSSITLGGVGVALTGSSTSAAGGHNHGITPGRYLKTYDSGGVELGLQLWAAASNHSHTQT